MISFATTTLPVGNLHNGFLFIYLFSLSLQGLLAFQLVQICVDIESWKVNEKKREATLEVEK